MYHGFKATTLLISFERIVSAFGHLSLLQMPPNVSQHPTCSHEVRSDDPRGAPVRPICCVCYTAIRDQTVRFIENRFFTVIHCRDFAISERYLWAYETALALARYDELELILWHLANDCVADHPDLFIAQDVDRIAVWALQYFMSDNLFEYEDVDARAFLNHGALSFRLQSLSLSGRQPSTISSAPIQLPQLDLNDEGLFDDEEISQQFRDLTLG
jgi:hypothetical protein